MNRGVTGTNSPNQNKSQQAIPPSIPQLIIHSGRKQQECKARQTPQSIQSRDGGRCISRIRVDGISLYSLETHNGAHAKDSDPNIRSYPMCVILPGPSVDEE